MFSGSKSNFKPGSNFLTPYEFNCFPFPPPLNTHKQPKNFVSRVVPAPLAPVSPKQRQAAGAWPEKGFEMWVAKDSLENGSGVTGSFKEINSRPLST